VISLCASLAKSIRSQTTTRRTHLVQAPIGIQLIHEAAQPLIREIALRHPFLLGMHVPHKLAHVDDPAEHVAQPIQILDHQPELFPRRIEGGVDDPLHDCAGVYERAVGKSREGSGGCKWRVEEEAG
jgi:hypothetical protein